MNPDFKRDEWYQKGKKLINYLISFPDIFPNLNPKLSVSYVILSKSRPDEAEQTYNKLIEAIYSDFADDQILFLKLNGVI